MGQIFLRKANNDVLSLCECDKPLIDLQAQADCPWCGCGWLFICSECNRPFTFAEAVEVEESFETLIRQRLRGTWTDEEVKEFVDELTWMLSDVKLGKTYVYFDGTYIDTTDEEVCFKGIYANHDLGVVPHVEALTDGSIVTDLLKNPSYWLQYRNEDEE